MPPILRGWFTCPGVVCTLVAIVSHVMPPGCEFSTLAHTHLLTPHTCTPAPM